MGFKNIKIYNGGIKDWKKFGGSLVAVESLQDNEIRFIHPDEVLKEIETAERLGCKDKNGVDRLTLLDLRTDNFKQANKPFPSIRTNCRTVKCLLDDLQKPEVRSQLPREGLIVTVTETGNRDTFAVRYLNLQGFNNVFGLQYGMRIWLKMNYPIVFSE